MGAISARVASALPAFLWALLVALLTWLAGALGLPDLGRLREILQRIQEILALGGTALALGVSLIFIAAWALSHLRRPKDKERPILSRAALWSSYVPVAFTMMAAAGIFLPFLAPYALKAFAIGVLVAAVSWNIAVATILAGGKRRDLARARKALLLAGTPWYCLAVWIATFL